MQTDPFNEAISEHVWHTEFQWSENGLGLEPSIEATWDRVALAVSSAEAHQRHEWRERFRAILSGFAFLPSGRILAGAGTARRTTLFNCFTAGLIEDSVSGIFSALRESMVTLQAGSALGIDFSTLRPAGTIAASSGGIASGPVSYLSVWEQAMAVLERGNPRHCVATATLRCDHPDIEAFIHAKAASTDLPHLHLSVLLSDDFLHALEEDGPWSLVFPLGDHPVPTGGEVCTRAWPGSSAPQRCLVHRRIPARVLWDTLLQAQHSSAQPGVLFVDHINRANNLWYRQQLSMATPCGEVPVSPHGCCSQGSINLTHFVQHPFSPHPNVDFAGLQAVAALATRFLDDVYDISLFPLKAQEKSAHAYRSLGLGVTGLADMLAMLGLRYGSPSSLELVRNVMGTVRDAAYRASIALAQEKGPFPAFDKVQYGASAFVLDLTRDIQDGISHYGIRNSHLLAVAPARTISLLANAVSCGVEPILDLEATRQVCGSDGQTVAFPVRDHAWRQYQALHGANAMAPDTFVQAADIDAEDQLNLIATVQSCVDGTIPGFVQLPRDTSLHALELALLRSSELGLKRFAAVRRAVAVPC